ncbi:MAG: hypothetical protein QM784_34955 [Polyangiaceae bacterium]
MRPSARRWCRARSSIASRPSSGAKLVEVPVGFKWFVDGLISGEFGFAGEESAGASFLRKDGAVWTTDKDGIILGLLAAEITAKTGSDPGVLYGKLTAELGKPCYARVDAPATSGARRRCSRTSRPGRSRQRNSRASRSRRS